MIALASSSPRRKKLMEDLFGEIMIVHPNVDESKIAGESPQEMVERLAKLKANSIKGTTSTVIAADTVVELEGKILGKPKDMDEAREMLRSLSGKWHMVHTGVCIKKADKEISFVSSTRVKFYDLDEQTIDMYVKTGSPLDKAGAYGIQEDLGMILVEKIDGDFFTVVGLPISRVWWEIKRLNAN
jgi:septum formation protein